MKYRALGKTGMMVSEVGSGGIPYQRISQEEVDDIILTLYNNGVNFIDSARGYTVSEEMIGKALKEHRYDFFVATKSMNRTYEGMKKDIEISLSNFQRDYIDLYQIHNLKRGEDYSGALLALKEAKEQGKVRHIGATFHNVDYAYELITKDDNPFETIQVPYNFLEDQSKKVIDKAYELNMGVLCMKPLAGGNIDRADVGLKYILQNNHISVAIPGMDSVRQANMNTKLDSINLSDEELEYIKKVRDELKGSFCHRCGYCMPCSVGIDIVSIFTFLNYHKRYHLEGWAKSRYDSSKVKASACIKCGKCESRCPYKINIIEKMKECVSIFEGKK